MSYERRKVRVGRVVSDHMDKTVVVSVEWRQPHRLYRKSVKKRTRLAAHDAENYCKTGDLVRIVETRPFSKTKRWRVSEVLSREEIAEIQPEDIAMDEDVLVAIPERPPPAAAQREEPAVEEPVAEVAEPEPEPVEEPVAEVAEPEPELAVDEPVAEVAEPEVAESEPKPMIEEPVAEVAEPEAEVEEESPDEVNEEESVASVEAPEAEEEEDPEASDDDDGSADPDSGESAAEQESPKE